MDPEAVGRGASSEPNALRINFNLLGKNLSRCPTCLQPRNPLNTQTNYHDPNVPVSKSKLKRSRQSSRENTHSQRQSADPNVTISKSKRKRIRQRRRKSTTGAEKLEKLGLSTKYIKKRKSKGTNSCADVQIIHTCGPSSLGVLPENVAKSLTFQPIKSSSMRQSKWKKFKNIGKIKKLQAAAEGRINTLTNAYDRDNNTEDYITIFESAPVEETADRHLYTTAKDNKKKCWTKLREKRKEIRRYNRMADNTDTSSGTLVNIAPGSEYTFDQFTDCPEILEFEPLATSSQSTAISRQKRKIPTSSDFSGFVNKRRKICDSITSVNVKNKVNPIHNIILDDENGDTSFYTMSDNSKHLNVESVDEILSNDNYQNSFQFSSTRSIITSFPPTSNLPLPSTLLSGLTQQSSVNVKKKVSFSNDTSFPLTFNKSNSNLRMSSPPRASSINLNSSNKSVRFSDIINILNPTKVSAGLRIENTLCKSTNPRNFQENNSKKNRSILKSRNDSSIYNKKPVYIVESKDPIPAAGNYSGAKLFNNSDNTVSISDNDSSGDSVRNNIGSNSSGSGAEEYHTAVDITCSTTTNVHTKNYKCSLTNPEVGCSLRKPSSSLPLSKPLSRTPEHHCSNSTDSLEKSSMVSIKRWNESDNLLLNDSIDFAI